MIKGVIFDVDGVVLDSMIIWNDLGERYLLKKGITPEAGLVKTLFSMSMEEGCTYLKENYNLSESEDEIMDSFKDMLRDFYFDEASLKPGIKELIEFLSKEQIPCALATSSPRDHITKALGRVGILDNFGDKFFTVEEVGKSKHFPDIYYKAMNALGTQPGETLVFEDSLYALKTASAAGFVTVGVYDASGEDDQENLKENSNLYITSFDQVIDNWDKLNNI